MRALGLFLLACLMQTGCAGAVRPDSDNPLVIANCPEALPPVQDDSFGGTVAKAIEWAAIYHKCRQAAIGAK